MIEELIEVAPNLRIAPRFLKRRILESEGWTFLGTEENTSPSTVSDLVRRHWDSYENIQTETYGNIVDIYAKGKKRGEQINGRF